MKKLVIYADTSVFGGCFDEEFQEESRMFFAEIAKGKFKLVISTTTLGELDRAPQNVQKVLVDLPPKTVEIIEYSEEIGFLRDEYIKAGVVGLTSKADAEHIAAATVAEVDILVSWN